MCGWVQILLLVGAGSALTTNDDSGVMLLQTQARMLNGPAASGTLVALNEAGYQSVAALKNNEEMKAFARRVIADNALEGTADLDAHLNGLVPYYSGKAAMQSFARLRDELSHVKWLRKVKKTAGTESKIGAQTGATAALTEEGYQALAALKNDAEMKIYMRRLVDMAGLDAEEVKSEEFEKRLGHLVAHYSGTKHVQSFARLFEELVVTPWVKHSRARNTKPSPLSLLALGNDRSAAAAWPSWLESTSKHVAELASAATGKASASAVPAQNPTTEATPLAASVDAAGASHEASNATSASSPPRHRRHPGSNAHRHRGGAAASASATSASTPAAPVALVGAQKQDEMTDEDNAEVFGALTSDLSVLRQNLAEEQNARDAAIAVASREYKARLLHQRQEIEEAVKANSNISKNVAQLRQDGAQLLETAGQLQRRQAELETELRSLEDGFSTALEFASESIAHVNELDKVSTLDVLIELQTEDAILRDTEAKKHKFEVILDGEHEFDSRDEHVALLELPRDAGPQDLLLHMSTNLAELDREAEAKKSSLNEDYLTKMHEGEHMLEELAEDAEKLRATEASLKERVSRLRVAVKYLQESCEGLEEKKRALNLYALRLGPAPK